MTPHRASLLLLFLIGGCSVDGAQKDRCLDDSQCNPGRVCVESFCRPIGAAPGDAAAGDAARDEAEPADGEPADQAKLDGVEPICGNGVTEAGEDCDDGNSSSGDRCTPSCAWVPFWQLAASGSHVCGLRTNGMVTCWGGPQDRCTPPEGSFASIAVGEFGSCGLTDRGSMTCWGGRAAGFYTYDSIAVGADFACGVDDNFHRLSCWGADGSVAVLQAPALETFVRVAAGGPSACAIAMDGHIRCWGGSAAINVEVPNDVFVDVAVGRFGACARRVDGVTSCWGTGVKRDLRFRSVFVGDAGICGVHDSGVVTCWGSQLYESPVPAGRFKEVAGTDEMICGIRDSGAISCWGPTVTSSELSPTAPPLHKIFAGYDGEVCGLDAGGVPRCPVYSGAKAPPRGPFESLALGASPTVLSNAIRCGLRPDGTVVCWGDSPLVARIPAGSYRQVVVGEGLVCLLDVGGQVKCWGERSSIEAYGEIPVPAGKYQQLSAGNVHVCALRADRSLACWSTDGSWDNHPPPEGTFVEVASGRAAACAVHTDGRTLCWGPMAPPGPVPTGLRQIGTANRQGYGLTEKGEIAVWGNPSPRSLPRGPFQSLVVGKAPCALRRDGELVCLGSPVVNGDSPR